MLNGGGTDGGKTGNGRCIWAWCQTGEQDGAPRWLVFTKSVVLITETFVFPYRLLWCSLCISLFLNSEPRYLWTRSCRHKRCFCFSPRQRLSAVSVSLMNLVLVRINYSDIRWTLSSVVSRIVWNIGGIDSSRHQWCVQSSGFCFLSVILGFIVHNVLPLIEANKTVIKKKRNKKVDTSTFWPFRQSPG